MDNKDILYLIFRKCYINTLLDVFSKVSKEYRSIIFQYILQTEYIHLKIDETINIKLNNILRHTKNKTIYLYSNGCFPSHNECYYILMEYQIFLQNSKPIIIDYDNLQNYKNRIPVVDFTNNRILLDHVKEFSQKNGYVISYNNNNNIKTKNNIFISINNKFYIGKCGHCQNCIKNLHCLNCLCNKCICKKCEKSSIICKCIKSIL
tara:strand:+ start:367 stop:984 length:618 start_codon:yes stop_codon:yes gene_type:complete